MSTLIGTPGSYLEEINGIAGLGWIRWAKVPKQGIRDFLVRLGTVQLSKLLACYTVLFAGFRTYIRKGSTNTQVSKSAPTRQSPSGIGRARSGAILNAATMCHLTPKKMINMMWTPMFLTAVASTRT